MAASPDGRDDAGNNGKMPPKRARLFIVLGVAVIAILVIAYMLLVSQVGR